MSPKDNEKALFILQDEEKYNKRLTWLNHMSDELIILNALEITEEPDGPDNIIFPMHASQNISWPTQAVQQALFMVNRPDVIKANKNHTPVFLI